MKSSQNPPSRNRLLFLGTGTSDGIPVIGCNCECCTSKDPKNRRTNASVLVTANDHKILIDCGKDFRNQVIQRKVRMIDHVLITHVHSDHIFGLDDLRTFNRILQRPIPVSGRKQHLNYICDYPFHFLFSRTTQKGGGIAELDMVPVQGTFTIADVTFEALSVFHGRLKIFGYKFLNCAYISDVSRIPPETLKQLYGLDVLILDALRYRSHSTHINLREALDIVEEVKPRKTYLTHFCHNIIHRKLVRELNNVNSPYHTEHDVLPAFDGLSIRLPSLS